MPGSIGVSPEGRGLPTQLSLFDEKQVAGHKRLVDAIHSKGSLVAAQLYHAGRQASEAITGLDPLAPSAIPCGILQNHPKEITHEQMDRIKEQFRQAARWSIEAGYDIVEVHSIDRLARNINDLLQIVKTITEERHAEIYFIKENLRFTDDTNNPFNKLTLQIIGSIAEFERNMIKMRQKEGIAIAKKKGVYSKERCKN